MCLQRRLSADVTPSLVSWLTTMMGMRLQVILDHMPVTSEQVLPYVRCHGDPRPVTPPAFHQGRGGKGVSWSGGVWVIGVRRGLRDTLGLGA